QARQAAPPVKVVLALDSPHLAGADPKRRGLDLRAIRSARLALGKPIWSGPDRQAGSGRVFAGPGCIQPLSLEPGRDAKARRSALRPAKSDPSGIRAGRADPGRRRLVAFYPASPVPGPV